MHQLSQIERVFLADLYDLAMSGEISPQTFVRRALGGRSPPPCWDPAGQSCLRRRRLGPTGMPWTPTSTARSFCRLGDQPVAEPDVRQRRELSASV